MSDSSAAPTAPAIEVHRIAGHIGAEIRGVRLGGDLDPATVAAIRQALVDHKVVFFRDQLHLDDQGQEAFAELIGTPLAHPTMPAREGTRYVLEFNSEEGGRAASWHTDATFIPAYPMASILRPVVLPAYGGDTVWANTAVAYDELPPALREQVDQLWAIHSNVRDFSSKHAQLAAKIEVFTATVYATEHPVVRVHPVSGQRTLLLGHFLREFLGHTPEETQSLYLRLQRHLTSLEYTVRWRWRLGDVAMWDNRATQHYAIDDYGDQTRIVRRVTLSGDVPVAIDGRSSRLLHAPSGPAPV